MSDTTRIAVDGARLWYEATGRGYPLVLLHAGIADARMWDDQVATLAERYTVVRYDARGFGRSDPPVGSFSPRADLAGLLSALGFARAHLVGCSMGGSVALDVALERPDLVSALVVCGASPSGYPRDENLVKGWRAVDEAFEAGDVAHAVELELQMWVDGPNRGPEAVDPAVREKVREMDAALFAMPDTGEEQKLDPPAIDRLADIRVPTLVLVGDQDQPSTVAAADLLAERIAGARKAVIEHTAHMPNMERPAEFNRLVLEFLAEVDGKEGGGLPTRGIVAASARRERRRAHPNNPAAAG